MEVVIGEAKNLHLLSRCRYRQLYGMKIQLFMIGSVINLKRLMKRSLSDNEIVVFTKRERGNKIINADD